MTETNHQGGPRGRRDRTRTRNRRPQLESGVERENTETLRARIDQIKAIAEKTGFKDGRVIRFLMAIITVLLPQIIAQAVAKAIGGIPILGKDLVYETMRVASFTLDVYTGPQAAVVQALAGIKNRRNITVLATHTYGSNPQATLVAFRENIEEAQAGEIAKKAFDRYLGVSGYSALTAFKAVNVKGLAWRIVIGEDLDTENVRTFAQAIETQMYRDGFVVGAAGEISTNLLLAPTDGRRQIAAWPVNNKMLYGVFDNNVPGDRFAFVGPHGLAKVGADGALSTISYAEIIDGVAKTVTTTKPTFSFPWHRLGTLKIGTVNDISFAFKAADGFYQIFAIGRDKTAVITLEAKLGGITVKGEIKYFDATSETLGGTPMTQLSKDTVLCVDRNGSGRALVIRDLKGLEDIGFPAIFTAPTAATPQATA